MSTVCQGEPSDTFLKCQEEVHAISCATLFSPVMRQEAVQAMGMVILTALRRNINGLSNQYWSLVGQITDGFLVATLCAWPWKFVSVLIIVPEYF